MNKSVSEAAQALLDGREQGGRQGPDMVPVDNLPSNFYIFVKMKYQKITCQ